MGVELRHETAVHATPDAVWRALENLTTGRDPERRAKIDPNAPYNRGVSVHPSDREPGASDA